MLKRNKLGKKIPILGYGSQTEPKFIEELTSEGLNAFLKRPLKFNLMKEIIQKLCGGNSDIFTQVQNEADSEKDDSTKFLLDQSQPKLQKIDLMVEYIDKMLAFPFTVAKVVKVTSEEGSSANSLAKAIEADPVISAIILKVSNTILFSARDKKITSVKEAIIRIGFMETRNIALSLSVLKVFDNDKIKFGFLLSMISFASGK